MKRTWKQIGSLFLSVCMVMTMLPTVAFAETNAKDSGAGLGISGRITDFADLADEVAEQTVKSGTAKDQLNLPAALTATLTKTVTTTTGAAVTADVGGEEPQPQAEPQETTETIIVPVSDWISKPEYNPGYSTKEETYTFIPTPILPQGVQWDQAKVGIPVISVTVKAAEGNIIEINSQSAWDTLIGNTSVIPATGGVIQLNADVSGSLSIDSSAAINLTIDGKGHSINGGISFPNSSNEANLTLKDLTVHPPQYEAALQFWKGGSLKTEGPVTLTGGDWPDNAGNGVFSNGDLTITASDSTTFQGGDSRYASNGVRLQKGSLTLNGGSPQFAGGTGTAWGGYGAEISDGDLIITSGSPTFTGGAVPSGNGLAGAYINGSLTITSPGSPRFTGADGIGQNSSTANGATVIGNLSISAGTPEFQGGAASGSARDNIAGDGAYVFDAITISGDASPTFTGGNGTASDTGGYGVSTNGDVTVSTSGAARFTAGANRNIGLVVDYGSGGLNLADLTGTYTAVGGTKAFSAAPSYPAGLKEVRKYDGTAASYTLDMTATSLTPLAIPDGLAWDSTTAKWNAVNHTSGYIIQLYKNNSSLGSSTPFNGTQYDFTHAMAQYGAGSYTFKVQAVGDGTTYSDSAWSGESVAYSYTPSGGTDPDQAAVDALKAELESRSWLVTDNTSGSSNVMSELYDTIQDIISNNSLYAGIDLMSMQSISFIPATPGVAGLITFTATFDKNGKTATTNTLSGTITAQPVVTTVTQVTISPATIEVRKGTNQQFGATVDGTNNPAQIVTWQVSGVTGSGTRISEGGLLTVGADETAQTLTVTVTSMVDTSKYGTATVTITDAAPSPVYSISLDTGSYTFPSTSVNYGAQAAKTITIRNTGNQPTGSLHAYLSGSDSSAFEVSPAFVSSIAKDGTGSFTVVPKTGLAAGIYGAALNVSGENGIGVSINVVFTVNAASPTLYAITFNANGGTFTAYTEADGRLLGFPTPSRSGGYTFDGWYTAEIGGTKITTETVFAANQNVYAHWTYTGGNDDGGGSGGSGGGGSSSGTTTPATTTPGKTPNQPVTAAAPVTATAGKNGAASASIPEKSVTDAIAKAQDDAKAQGKTANGTTVALNVTMPKGAASLTAELTRKSLDSLVSAGVRSLELNGSPVTVSFDTKALAEIQKQSSGNISITIAPNAKLSASAKTMIGTRPVYDLTVSYTKDGKNATVTSFGGGTATVFVPYTPAKGEAIGGLYAVYVDAKGNATRIAGSAYDANSGCVLFTTTHFSLYGIGYTAPSAKFTDMTNHWAKESIDYVVGRGLLSGTSDTTFAPDTAMTRGMLVTALGRLASVDTKAYTTNSFTDVTADSAFRPYIEWAYGKSIIQGIGNSQFAPERAITREEIAVIFANFAKATGYTLPVTRTATTYADASSIGEAYKTAVTAMQQAGIMMGGSGNKFNPKSSATRAEVSSMLHRYIKLTIDPATAQGWAQNDAGQYLYYKDSKALTGTQTIGSATYFFNTDGTLKTGWVKDDAGNWRFYSGNIMLVGFWDLGANGESKRYYFTKDGIMIAGKWLEIDGKWYYFNADGSLARSTKIDGYEVDENGARKAK